MAKASKQHAKDKKKVKKARNVHQIKVQKKKKVQKKALKQVSKQLKVVDSVNDDANDQTPAKSLRRVSFSPAIKKASKPNPTMSPGGTPKSILKTKRSENIAARTGSRPAMKRASFKKPSTSFHQSEKKPLSSTAQLVMEKKELKRQKLEQKLAKRPQYALVLKTKKIWEELRNRKTDQRRRDELTEELVSFTNGKVKTMIFTHDGVRIIQCLMSLNNRIVRNRLFDEMKDDVRLMAKSKYAKFFVVKMLKYGRQDQRAHIIQSLFGYVGQLFRHTFASEVVECAYDLHANALQRSQLASEFYLAEFAVEKVKSAIDLTSLLTAQPDRKEEILKFMKHQLEQLAEKPVLARSFTHRLFAEYFEHCELADKKEMIESLKERLVDMVHTRDGARVAMQCIWHGSVKDRKSIVKIMKAHVARVCMEEHGFAVICAIFDTVDDTVMVHKNILLPIKNDLKKITENKYGAKVVLYILQHRDKRIFHPETLKWLVKGDGNAVSKKLMDTRIGELRTAMSPYLIEYLSNHIRELMFYDCSSLLVLAVLCKASGDKSAVYSAIADLADEEFVAGNVESYHLVEHPQTHFVLQHALDFDKTLVEQNLGTLTETLCANVSLENLRSWVACNKGCFVLIKMIESNVPDCSNTLRSTLMPCHKQLNSYSFTGAKILLKKLIK